MKHVRLHYYSHRGRHKHPTTYVHRVGSGLVLPLLLVVLAVSLTTGIVLAPDAYTAHAGILLAALGASMVRLFGAYILSLAIGIPMGLIAERNKKIESFLLPIYDVFESMPVLAFFPVIILFFIREGWAEGAALFIIFFSMIWNIIFNTIGGIKVTPEEVKSVGKVFGLSPWQRFAQITLPALFPPLITGSILALADGWNIVIVAEALHAYSPSNVQAHDLFGIGSILVHAAATGDTVALFTAMGVLVAAIALINIFIWQPLLGHAERYKFE